MVPSERVRVRLQTALDRDGWTQREFAQKMKKSQPWLQKILTGENHLRLDDLDDVADALRVPPAELIRAPENELVEVRPTELLLLRAMRALDAEMQEHTIAVVTTLAAMTPTRRSD